MEEATSEREDRLLAALAHALIVASWLGAIGAAAIYALNRGRSRFVAFHALQAAVYQLATVFLSLVCWACWLAGYMGSLVPILANPHAYPEPPAWFWLGLLAMFIPCGLMGLFLLYGLWGAISAYRGKPFRYLIIGQWVASQLG